MTAATRKVLIGRAFGRAAHAYDAHAGIQAEVARELARRVLARAALPEIHQDVSAVASPTAQGVACSNPSASPAAPLSVLEVGCGTGFLTDLLLASRAFAPYVCTDLSPDMVLRCRQRLAHKELQASTVLYAVMDAEAPAASGPFDLVTSSMALQWTSDLGRTLAGLGRLVRPSGRLVLAVPGADTFHEWRSALHGLECGIPDFPTSDSLYGLVPDGFSGQISEQHHVVDYGSGLTFLRSLKAMGAAQPRPGYHPLPPAALRTGLDRLDSAGPRLTWHILYAVLRKAPDPMPTEKEQ